jgi:hypothetical protein
MAWPLDEFGVDETTKKLFSTLYPKFERSASTTSPALTLPAPACRHHTSASPEAFWVNFGACRGHALSFLCYFPTLQAIMMSFIPLPTMQ